MQEQEAKNSTRSIIFPEPGLSQDSKDNNGSGYNEDTARRLYITSHRAFAAGARRWLLLAAGAGAPSRVS